MRGPVPTKVMDTDANVYMDSLVLTVKQVEWAMLYFLLKFNIVGTKYCSCKHFQEECYCIDQIYRYHYDGDWGLQEIAAKH